MCPLCHDIGVVPLTQNPTVWIQCPHTYTKDKS